MVDNSRIVLENNQEYLVMDKISYGTFFYVYLTNPNNPTDFCCRKEIEEEGKTYLVGLDNQEEAELALKLFAEKHKND